MHSSLIKLSSKQNTSRLIIGLMSGTSLDGLDIALCKIEDSGKSTTFELLEFESIPYQDDYLNIIQPLFAKHNATLHDVTLANAKIARIHAQMVLDCLQKWEANNSDIDLIASHGQTIYHAPKSFSKYSATLQIGDGDHLSQLTQIATLSDFRQKHVAAGGEGAPLVPYSDFLMYNDDIEDRMLLNIGGISNFTYIPANSRFESIQFGDIGPGNTLMDQLIVYAKSRNESFKTEYSDARFDKDGNFARQGNVIPTLLKILMAQLSRETTHHISTGQEVLNISFIKQAWLELSFYSEYRVRTDHNVDSKVSSIELPTYGQSFFDLMATLNQFTALTIVKVINRLLAGKNNKSPLHIYISGGGVHNSVLMENIENELINIPCKVGLNKIDVLGVSADAKEAVMFAVLANETIYGDFTKVFAGTDVSISGLGKLSFP